MPGDTARRFGPSSCHTSLYFDRVRPAFFPRACLKFLRLSARKPCARQEAKLAFRLHHLRWTDGQRPA